MQRRAAAAYATLFLLLAAGAYLMIGVAQEPAIALDDAAVDHSVGAGEEFEVDGRTYTVDGITGSATLSDREGTLVWVNESEKQTATIENDTEVPAADVSWPGQTARSVVTFGNGSTVSYNDSEYTILVDDGSVTLQQGNETEEFSVGDTFTYRGNETTVVAAADGSATIAWGDPYLVVTQTADNDSVDFRQSFNVSGILASDPAVEDETVTRADGREYVVYENGTTQPLTEYLPEPEVKTVSEGDILTYNVAEEGIDYEDVTVEDVSAERVLVSWRAPVTHEVDVAEGANVTLGPNERRFVAHFPDNGTLQLSSNIEAYQTEVEVQETYHKRIDGLWGVSILASLAAIFLIGMAYLPSRY